MFSVQCLSAGISGSVFGMLSLLCLKAAIACWQKYDFFQELLFFKYSLKLL